MSLDPETRNQAYKFFVAEAPELLQSIESGLLTLAEDYNTAKVHSIMRAAHSIKGGAAGVGLEGIKAIAHRLEDIFKALYHAEDKITLQFEQKLLQAYDCLQKPLTQQIKTGNYDAETAVKDAENILSEIEAELGEAMEQGDDFIPGSEDLGVDMASSIFQVDVEAGVEHLQKVIENPQKYEVAGEVRAQAEVFIGIAEIVGLSGFGEIAQKAIEALDAHPEDTLNIARIVIRDLEAGRNAFLNGDRKRGGEPSPELLSYTQTSLTDAIDLVTFDADDLFGDETPDPEEITVNADDLFGDETPDPEEITVNADDLFGDETSETETPPQNLDEAITSIQQNFDTLPPIENLPTPPVQSFSPSLETPVTEKKTTPKTASQASIRVEVERLQAMDNQLGELVIQRNSLAVQNEQLQRELRELLNRFSRFRDLVGKLQEFSDQEIIRQGNQNTSSLQTSQTNGTGNEVKSSIEEAESFLNVNFDRSELDQVGALDSILSEFVEEPESVLNVGFDSLELDQYGALNAALQELLEETAQIEEAVGDVSLFAQQSDQTLKGQRKMFEQLRDELIWARMLPLSDILDRFPRILRDFSHQYNKPTRLKLEGTGVRVDKSVLEKLYDPLSHLVRNAFDHGIESSQRRQEAEKSETGQITIRAYYQGNQTVIEVADDGGGINLEKVKAKAINVGLLTEEQAERSSPERLYNLLFEPGFSTAKEVSDLSGRGVGLDVVREEVRELKGRISVRSQQGKGTTFVLSLPTTQSMAKLLIVLVETTIWALPSDTIEQILVPSSQQVRLTGNQRFLRWDNQAIPIYFLSELLDYNCPIPAASPDLQALGAVTQPPGQARPLLILRRGEQRFPLEIDRVITEQELVIKSFGKAITSPSYVSGCTILGDGKVVPVLDGFALLETVQFAPRSSLINTSSSRSLNSQNPTILVVDDSATQRQTLNFSLQRVGYQVLQAADGREAISVLERHPDTDLVICDIEMPNLNGFEFLRYRRQHTDLKKIPVVMLTSRSGEKHRKLCEHLGARQYFTKPYLEKEFISSIESILVAN